MARRPPAAARPLAAALPLLALVACASPPTAGPAAPAGWEEERPPTAAQIAARCGEYGYLPDTPEWDECVRLEERDFLVRPKRFYWPGEGPGG